MVVPSIYNLGLPEVASRVVHALNLPGKEPLGQQWVFQERQFFVVEHDGE